MDVVDKKVGDKGEVKVTFTAAGLVVSASYGDMGSIVTTVSTDAVILAIEEHTGPLVDAGLEVLRNGLKKIA